MKHKKGCMFDVNEANEANEANEEKSAENSGSIDENKDEEKVKDNDKDHLNLVLIGHVDHGKSTIAGQILFS